VIEVSLGGSTILNLNAKRVTLTDPSIAEITKPSESILLIGRKVGETNLVAITETGSETYLIKVSLPALAIQSEIISLFPNERDVRTKAVGGALVLEGTVSTIQVINQMEAVATGYLLSPSIVSLGVKPNVINLLTVCSPQQV
jgi:Flp pilus assembly secretin CpaC